MLQDALPTKSSQPNPIPNECARSAISSGFEVANVQGGVASPNGCFLRRFDRQDETEGRSNDAQKGYPAKDLINPALVESAIEEPDKHSLWATISEDNGQSLEECETPWDLCECLLHAMLTWLAYYQHGYHHQNVSIGNVLRLKKRSERRPFCFRRVLQLMPNTEAALVDLVAGLNVDHDTDSCWDKLLERATLDEQTIVILARDIEKKIQALGIQADCMAILSDSDVPAKSKGYYSDRESLCSISGTPEFMSKSLRQASQLQAEYVQNPTDDMESFLWATIWAVLFNTKMPATSHDEREWQAGLRKEAGIRGSVLQDFIDFGAASFRPYSAMVGAIAPVLGSWKKKLVAAQLLWIEQWEGNAHNLDSYEKELLFHKFAYSGVLDFIKVISSHRETLIKASQLSM